MTKLFLRNLGSNVRVILDQHGSELCRFTGPSSACIALAALEGLNSGQFIYDGWTERLQRETERTEQNVKGI